MRGHFCVRAALIVAFLGGGVPAAYLFVGTADAKEYYTRKRVNGRWITGRFPKRSAEKPKIATSQAPTEAAEEAPSPAPAKPAPATAAPAPASPLPPTVVTAQSQDSRLAPLQKALEQRARSMATHETGATSKVRTVTYDFDKGRKTIIYLDGTITEEPLDPSATGQINARP
jgi:pyruvate/2-oxoglutarate dehydrogenase complex dihydrolipoamide acyltransferase (E2) component